MNQPTLLEQFKSAVDSLNNQGTSVPPLVSPAIPQVPVSQPSFTSPPVSLSSGKQSFMGKNWPLLIGLFFLLITSGVIVCVVMKNKSKSGGGKKGKRSKKSMDPDDDDDDDDDAIHIPVTIPSVPVSQPHISRDPLPPPPPPQPPVNHFIAPPVSSTDPRYTDTHTRGAPLPMNNRGVDTSSGFPPVSAPQQQQPPPPSLPSNPSVPPPSSGNDPNFTKL
jgi:hypothetical protein